MMTVKNLMTIANEIHHTLINMKVSQMEYALIIKILDCYVQTEIDLHYFIEKESEKDSKQI